MSQICKASVSHEVEKAFYKKINAATYKITGELMYTQSLVTERFGANKDT